MQASEAERGMVEGARPTHRVRGAPSTAFGGPPPPLRGGGEDVCSPKNGDVLVGPLFRRLALGAGDGA
jgi:hypothetical protein